MINTMINLLISALAISMLIQAFFFFFAAKFKTDKVTDLSYSLTFILIALFLIVYGNSINIYSMLIALAIIVWGLRLGTYLFIRILKIKKDSRFDDIRDDFLRFAKFWTLQGITVWVVMLPIIVFFGAEKSEPISWVFWTGLAIWAVGLTIETIADIQKYSFINDPTNKGKWIRSGLWKYSRHPNYFGEILCWMGLFIAVFTSFSGFEFLSVIGPLFIASMILFVTGIPPTEKSADKKFGGSPEYQNYKKNTSILIPLPKIHS